MTEGSERRRVVRLRTLKGARLILPNHSSTFQCMVRNMSTIGACVELPSTVGINHNVMLRLDDGSPERSCEVVWRTERRLGLRFL